MKVSVLVAIYKDIEALELIFDSMSYQTYENFEVVIAEDAQSEVLKDFVELSRAKYNFDILHTTQEDKGVRKSKSQNNAIRESTGEYLILIDGDCILYSNFIESHVALSGDKNIVTGRRVNVGPKYSAWLRDKTISPLLLEKKFIQKYLDIKEDAKTERHSEEGFSIKANGFIHKWIKIIRKKELSMLGCNMSFYKKAILEINGFDEGLGNSAMAGDTDLEWRFKGLGYKMISARYIANEFHLYHKRSSNDYDRDLDEKMLENIENSLYICTDGIEKI